MNRRRSKRLSATSMDSANTPGRPKRHSTHSVMSVEFRNGIPELSDAKAAQKQAQVSWMLEHGYVPDANKSNGQSAERTGSQSSSSGQNGDHEVRKGNGSRSDHDPASSRSASPSAPFSAASEQSRTPTSPSSPTFTSLPQYPSSPSQMKHGREGSRSFFQNMKASKSSAKIQPSDSTIKHVPADVEPDEPTPTGPRRTKSTPDLGSTEAAESVPDVPRLDRSEGSQSSLRSNSSSHTIPRRPVGSKNGSMSRSNLASMESSAESGHAEGGVNDPRWGGHKISSFFKRNLPSRGEEQSRSNMAFYGKPTSSHGRVASRDHSETRGSDGEQTRREHPKPDPSSREGPANQEAGSRLFGNLKLHKTTKETVKSSKGLFSRNKVPARSAPPLDFATNYTLTVVNLPIALQVRKTRLVRLIESSKDKTEFWLPAIAWRCIDYLNLHGIKAEGIYRVPGSEREVRYWKARFDKEGDINLFEAENLYDVNCVASLFKSWLRELPDELFPKHLQEPLCSQHGGTPNAPDALKKVLSELPPQNYYLLFAITCHLSLLLENAEFNKMSMNNLLVCIGPGLKLNGDVFNWMVGDWKNCWIGCNTERHYLEEEYRSLKVTPADRAAAAAAAKKQIEDDYQRQKAANKKQAQDAEPPLERIFREIEEQMKPDNAYYEQRHSLGVHPFMIPLAREIEQRRRKEQDRRDAGRSRKVTRADDPENPDAPLEIPASIHKWAEEHESDAKVLIGRDIRNWERETDAAAHREKEEVAARILRAPPSPPTAGQRKEEAPRGLRQPKGPSSRPLPEEAAPSMAASGKSYSEPHAGSLHPNVGNIHSNRSASQLPEFDFPPSISPTFAPKGYNDI